MTLKVNLYVFYILNEPVSRRTVSVKLLTQLYSLCIPKLIGYDRSPNFLLQEFYDDTLPESTDIVGV